MENETQPKSSRMKAVAITVVVMGALGAIFWLWMAVAHRSAMNNLRTEMEAKNAEIRMQAGRLAGELAMDVALVLGSTISDDVARVENAMLESQLAAIVRGRRVAGVIVLNPKGEVLATTDQRYAGRTLEDEASKRSLAATEVTLLPGSPAPGQVEVAAPLYIGPERVGAIRVFIEVKPFVVQPRQGRE